MKKTLRWILENIEEGEVYKNTRFAVKEIFKKDGVICFKQRDNSNLTPFKLDNEYEKVQEPVDFLTAVKSGKKLIVSHELITDSFYNEYRRLSDILEALGNNYFSAQVSDIILNGKWYIEEDDE